MGKMHERFKSRMGNVTATVSTVDVGKYFDAETKSHYIDFVSKGFINIFAVVAKKTVTVDQVAQLALLTEEVSAIEEKRLHNGSPIELNKRLEKIGFELHKLCGILGIDDTNPNFRKSVQAQFSDLLTETREEMKAFVINKITKDFLNTPSEPGSIIIDSGVSGPFFEASDLSRFKAK